MRIMTIHAIHLPFQHRITLRQAKLGMLRLMAAQTRLRILAGIVNENAFSAAGLNVFASGSVARFATANLPEPGLFLEKARVNAAGKQSRKSPRDIRRILDCRRNVLPQYAAELQRNPSTKNTKQKTAIPPTKRRPQPSKPATTASIRRINLHRSHQI